MKVRVCRRIMAGFFAFLGSECGYEKNFKNFKFFG
jgi:hypothetical protein